MRTSKFSKFLAMALTVAILLVAMPQSVLAAFGDAIFSDGSDENEAAETFVIDAIGEVIASREETIKHFRMNDGSYRAVQYAQPVHFKDADEWLDYDNTLVLNTSKNGEAAYYSVKQSDLSIRLAVETEGSQLMSVGFGNYALGITAANTGKTNVVAKVSEQVKPDKDASVFEKLSQLSRFNSEITYKNLYPNADLKYNLSGAVIKEDIVIKKVGGEYIYRFAIDANGMKAELDKNGNIVFFDANGEGVFVMPKGYMYDANGESSNDVTYELSFENEKYVVSVCADKEWIENSDRSFPVTVDPSIELLKKRAEVQDTYITQNAPNLNSYQRAEIIAGYYLGNANKECHALIRPINLPSIPASSVIVDAKLYLMHMPNGTEYTSVNLAAKAITSSWTDSTATWNNRPTYGDNILDYVSMTAATSGSFVPFDVTSLVQSWYNRTVANNGIAIVPISGYGVGRIYFGSSDYTSSVFPHLIVSYRDTKGLEGTWSFASHGAGNAGTGNVNLFNGNLVLVRNDTATKGELLPVSVSHVYNSYMAGKQFTGNGEDIIAASFDNMKVGYGWKLSVEESVKYVDIDNRTWYVYNDSDGTEHYFMPEMVDGKHLSEDGLPIYLQAFPYNTDKYLITDDYGNTKYFNQSGKLAKMTDAFGNTRNFIYNSDGQLTSISLTPNGGSTVTQDNFTYNANGALKKITNATDTSDYTEFYYSTTYNGGYSTSYSGYLRYVYSTKHGSTNYYYGSDGTLSYTLDNDTSYRIDYTYTTYHDAKRIASVTEKGVSTTGQKIGFTYTDKKTIVRTSGQNDIYNDSDDILTTYLFDNYGRTVCSYSSDWSGNTVYGTAYAQYTPTAQASKKNNKIAVDSVKGTTTDNLLLNGNCESSTSWSSAYSGSGYTYSLTSAEKLYGNYSFKLASTSTSTGYYRKYQTVSIPEAGTYTLSAYVKTNAVNGTNGGAYITLAGAESDKITGTTNTAIQDGWQRISATKYFNSATTATIELRLANASGTAYFDCIQLEKGEVASNYNLLQNGGMTLSSGWSATPAHYTNAAKRSIKIDGNVSTTNFVSQTVSLNIPKETTLMLSGWGKANSVPTGEDNTGNLRTYRIVANLLYEDGTREDQAADFNPNVTDWQYSATAIVPKKAVTSITVYLSYDYNGNTAYFDDVALTIEPAQTYTYDDNGNLRSTLNQDGNEILINYVGSSSDIANFTNIYGHKYDYEYLTVNNVSTHSVSKMKKMSSDGNTAMQILSYQYDAYGNIIDTTLAANGQSAVVHSESAFIENGNFLSSMTDALGGVTSKGYTGGKLLAYVQNALNNRTGYLYDSRDRITQVYNDKDKDGVIDSNEEQVQYIYSSNRLSELKTGSTTYHFVYDSFGNVTQVKAGNSVLVTFTYRSGNGKLIKRTFANNDIEEYIYDALDRLVSVKYNGVVTYTFTYDANGALAKCTDHKSGLTHEYVYDSLGRLVRAWQKNTSTGVKTLAVENSYDDYGRSKGSSYVVNDQTLQYSVTYNTANGLASYLDFSDTTRTAGISYTYDAFERLTSTFLCSAYCPDIQHQYSYYTANGKTTSLISQERVSCVGNSKTYNYTYDALGNITSISEGNSTKYVYEYDSLGQLIRVDDYDASAAYVYCYDKSGNIAEKYIFANNGLGAPAGHWLATYPYIGEKISTYTYGNSDYGDLLTNYNGTTIIYSANYNPLNWRNASSFTWSGRTLTNASLANGTAVAYNYNGFGTRIEKTVGNTVHRYMLDGNNIIAEVVTGDENYVVYYYYDAAGSIIGLRYNNADYYFLKNWRGDVLGIANDNGFKVVEYTYDAWGKVTSVTGSAANTVGRINPIRYRGYYYDEETGFYYLNTRYYDPEVGRFISPDSTDVLTASPSSLTDKNLFAYCDNNPVMYKDDGGEFWHILAGAVVGAVVGAVSSVVSQALSGEEINWKAVGISAASGAVSGAINAAFPCAGPIVTGVVEGTISAVTYAATEKIAYGRDPDPWEVVKVGVTSGITAGVGKKIAQDLGVVQCFISGTIVATACCNKPIDDIQPGDLVWATDPETGKTELKEVARIFRGETYEWVHITVNGEEIICTPGHPFYLPDRGWATADKLHIGDSLVTLDGKSITIQHIYHQYLSTPETTYNFEVEGFHTYYVGTINVLVHNKCQSQGTEPKQSSTHESRNAAYRAAKRDAGIPMNEQPVSVTKSVNRAGKTIPGRTYQYSNGTIIMEHSAGHPEYGLGPHFNVLGSKNHYFY